MLLTTALDRLLADDLSGAHAALVAAWLERRLPAIAETLATVEKRLPASAERGPFERARAAWEEVVRLPEDNKRRRARLEALIELPDDPRLAPILLDAADLYSRAPLRREVWPRLFARLGALRDVRVLDGLRAIEVKARDDASHAHHFTLDAISGARAALEIIDAAPSEAETQTLARIDAALHRERSAAATERELLEAVYAAPDDDGPRAVYADFLLERGDPRGEFITLQLAATRRPLTPSEQLRERELLRLHGRAWLGPMGLFVGETFRYERGFVVACRASWPQGLTLDEQIAGRRDPAWATVREVIGLPPCLIQHLSRLTEYPAASLDSLKTDTPFAVEDLEVLATVSLPETLAALIAFLERAGDALPRLRRLGVTQTMSGAVTSPSLFRPLIAAAARRRVTTFFTPSGCATLWAWLHELGLQAAPPELEAVELDEEDYNAGLRLRLARAADGRFTRLRAASPRRRKWGHTPADLLVAALEPLTTGSLTEVDVAWDELKTTKAARKQIDALVTRALVSHPNSV